MYNPTRPCTAGPDPKLSGDEMSQAASPNVGIDGKMNRWQKKEYGMGIRTAQANVTWPEVWRSWILDLQCWQDKSKVWESKLHRPTSRGFLGKSSLTSTVS